MEQNKIPYLVVGTGIAGISICTQYINHKIPFRVVSGHQPPATAVSGGVINPVVLKRFNPVWKADEFLQEAKNFYEALETLLNTRFCTKTPIYQVFSSVEMQNNWSVASDKNKLSKFLQTQFENAPFTGINTSHKVGKVLQTLKINIEVLLSAFQQFLKNNNLLLQEALNYNEVTINKDQIVYRNSLYKAIIFCEGSKVIDNPWFKKKLIHPKKGEYIVIKAPQLKLESIIKSSFFIIPLGQSLFKIGATFVHKDFENIITTKSKQQLITFLDKILSVPYEVVNQEYGFRPTVSDRKPLLGNFDENPNIYFFNGLGTRGLLMAPLLSKWLFNHVTQKQPLPNEVDINRF